MQHNSSVQICFQCAYVCQPEIANYRCEKAVLAFQQFQIPAVPNSQFVLKLLISNCIAKYRTSNVRNSEFLPLFKMEWIYKENHI